MKPEKEVFWLVNILTSKFKKKIFGVSTSGCKSDFEKVSGASLNNKEFHTLLKELIDEGILEFFEKKQIIGGFVDTYVVNEKKMIRRIKSTDFGKKFYKSCVNDYLSLRVK